IVPTLHHPYTERHDTDDSEERPTGNVYRVRKLHWRSQEITRKIASNFDGITRTNAYGNTPAGSQPRQRIRLSDKRAASSRRKARAEWPINFYDADWIAKAHHLSTAKFSRRFSAGIPRNHSPVYSLSDTVFLTLSIAMSQSQIPAWTIPHINPVTPSVLADYGLAQPDPTNPTKLIDAPLDKSKGRVYKIDGDIYYSPNCSRDGLKAPMFGTGTPECDPRVDKIKNFLTPAYWDSPLTTYLAFMPLAMELGKPPLDALGRSSPVYRTRQGFWVDAQQGLGFTRLEHTILKIFDNIAIYF
ncbi:hypothetical protein CVT24_008140, partial [Panaeolus cyanescens]